MAKQLTHTMARLNRLETRTPERSHEIQNEPEPDFEPEFGTPVNPREAPTQNLFQEPNPRRPQQHQFCELVDRRPTQIQLNQDDRTIKNVRLEAPTFDGILDPKIYIDWEGEMDQYFDWYDMTEDRKCRFTKLKLVHQARLYWENVEILAMGHLFRS